jgi:Protein of unknown function (DUF2911)
MPVRVLPRGVVAFVVLFLLPDAAGAQIRASEHALTAQTVDGTTITVEYYRPQMRGRDSLYGGVVRWSEVWTPGANWATTFEVDQDVRVEGVAVPKGKYSVWIEVKPEAWTLYFNPKARTFHLPEPKPADTWIRIPVKRESRPPMEVLSWWFPEVRPDGAKLAFQWGTEYVPLRITVPASHPIALAADVARRYVGAYTFKWTDQPDSAKASNIDVYHEGGALRARWDKPPFPEFGNLILVPSGEHWFWPAMLEKGEVFDVANDIVFEFAVTDGRATGFEVRDTKDEVIAKGTRKD